MWVGFQKNDLPQFNLDVVGIPVLFRLMGVDADIQNRPAGDFQPLVPLDDPYPALPADLPPAQVKQGRIFLHVSCSFSTTTLIP
jgi:hypothetical protein